MLVLTYCAVLSRQHAGLRQFGQEKTCTGYLTTVDLESMVKNYDDGDTTAESESDDIEPNSEANGVQPE